MGLAAEKIQKWTSVEKHRAPVQSCQSLGIRQQQTFTIGGVFKSRKLSVDRVHSVTDIMNCGAIGYVYQAENVCILDPQTAIMVYSMYRKLQSSEQTNCRRIFRTDIIAMLMPEIQTHAATGLLRYQTNNLNVIDKIINKINQITMLNPKYIDTINTLPILFNTYIQGCVSELREFIQNNKTDLYGHKSKNHSGQYIFYQFGIYEIPLFWWLKHSISIFVYNTVESQAGMDIRSLQAYAIDGYEHRMAKDSNFIGKLPVGTTLQQFWSRINTDDLNIFDRTSLFLITTLEEFTMTGEFELSIGMHCPTELGINTAAIKQKAGRQHGHAECRIHVA